MKLLDNPYSTTLTPPFVHVCQASENGIPCWRHAEIAYKTTAWLDFPSETRFLCKMHYALLWRMVLANLKERVLTQECMEAAEDYEPYYSRADEMADIANADYYDEIARGGRVA
jgi:hypothetical protein